MVIIMVEYSRICEKLRYGGIPVLNITVSFPEHELLREIAEASLEWARTALFDKVCLDYESDTDTKKKFNFGYEYKYDCVICFCGDGLISAKIDVSLKDRRTRNTVAENEFGLLIRRSDGAILPIEAVADKKTVKNYRRKRGKSFYIDERGIILISEDGSESLICDDIVDILDFKRNKC